jgi:phospholipid/cholesterol/gamma-HCH transport system permease protein
MGWVTATLIEPISLMRFVNTGFKGAGFKDFLPPTFKTCVYGMIIGTIASFTGMRAKGGAQGVGSAATTSVVLSSLFVIFADVILVKLILLIFP